MKSKDYFGYTVFENGDVHSKESNGKRKLKLRVGARGYYDAGLYINGERKATLIHRVVAKCFIPNPENKPQVNHKDGNKLNNQAENLEWCTGSENVLHAHTMGLRVNAKGSDDKRSIPVSQYDLNGNFIAEYGSMKEAERITGIYQGNIARLIRKHYGHAGGYLWQKA